MNSDRDPEFEACPRFQPGAPWRVPLTKTLTPDQTMKTPELPPGRFEPKGKIGYILLWLMGVPASLLFVIFLLRGCT
jgi:hypothetical protein